MGGKGRKEGKEEGRTRRKGEKERAHRKSERERERRREELAYKASSGKRCNFNYCWIKDILTEKSQGTMGRVLGMMVKVLH
jgi:hypothetical protein